MNRDNEYIPDRWRGSPSEARMRELWSRRQYRLRMVREGRWNYPKGGARGACRAVYYADGGFGEASVKDALTGVAVKGRPQ